MAVATPSNIQANLIRQYWDLKLYDESLLRDVFSRLRTVFDHTSNIDIPLNTLIFELNAQVNTGYRTATLGFIRALDDTPRYGDLQQQLTNEETLRQKDMTIYYNEFSHAVSLYNYGIHYDTQAPYGINMGLATRLLGNYMEELGGLHFRQALLQRLSVNLTFSPVGQAQSWNNNWYVKNVTNAAQPAYSPTLQTFTNNIATALIAAGTGVAATLDDEYLTALVHRITTERIEPLMINGKKGYILTVPTNQVYHVRQLDRTDSLAAYWTSVARMPNEEKAIFPDLLGRWVNIWLVEDERAPTLTVTGSAAPFTVTPQYVHPGNNDQRDTSSGARDVGFLLGKAPLVDWYPVRIHHKFDDYNYQKWEGKGAFGERGVQLRWYDDVTSAAGTPEQRFSIVCPFARGTITN